MKQLPLPSEESKRTMPQAGSPVAVKPYINLDFALVGWLRGNGSDNRRLRRLLSIAKDYACFNGIAYLAKRSLNLGWTNSATYQLQLSKETVERITDEDGRV